MNVRMNLFFITLDLVQEIRNEIFLSSRIRKKKKKKIPMIEIYLLKKKKKKEDHEPIQFYCIIKMLKCSLHQKLIRLFCCD